MKAALILLCLALFAVAIHADCDPDGNGIPNCSGTSTTRYRNNWDPTRYWVCEGNTPTVVICDIGLGYDPVSSECIPWSQWQWYPVCPESA